MVSIALTRHLFQFFPQLADREVAVEAATVAEAVRALDDLAPGIAFYICDERGRLRPHVNIFVGKEAVRDRMRLSDPVAPGDTLSILQALSGG
ncbi:MAG: MoaD/ThiS family protein [Myxococcales bacterium]|nr:MoaD/ThiS family protein [Myxococcales bacterium]